MEAVVEKNKYYEVEIIDMSEEGQGVGKVQDFTLFIEGGILGDQVEVYVTQVKKTFAMAKVTKLIKASPFREDSKCKNFQQCGGCQLQEMQYEAQLAWKEERVVNCLKRIGKVKEVPIEPIIGMDKKERYRNKAQYPIRKINDKVKIGFFMSGSHELIPIEDCKLLPHCYQEIVEKVEIFLETYGISIFDEKLGKGLVRHLVIKSNKEVNEVMVCLVINGKQLPHQHKWIESLCEIEQVKSIVLCHTSVKCKRTLGTDYSVIYGKDYITDYIEDLAFKISPLAFFQVNAEQTQKLYKKVVEYANLTGNEIVWDAYCGIGSISLFLARQAKQVYGVEIIGQAIQDATENAKCNKVSNTCFYTGKAEEVIPRLYNEGIVADVIVVDPPRKGCDSQLLQTLCQMSPKTIVYVSCNPSTLGRDLQYLTTEGNYKVEKVQPIDMFGHTMHVETVCCLQRVNM